MNLEDYLPQADQTRQLIEENFDAGFAKAKGRAPEGDERKIWMQQEDGAQIVNDTPPVAFAVKMLPGTDLLDPQSFLRPSVQISPIVNPLFHALMVELGATPKGVRSYEVSARKGKNLQEQEQITKALKAILKIIPGSICYGPSAVEQGERSGFQSWNISRHMVFREVYHLIRDTTAGEQVKRAALKQLGEDHPTSRTISNLEQAGEDISQLAPLSGAAVVFSSAKGRIFVKVCTSSEDGGLFLSDEDGTPDLDRLRPAGRLDPQLVTPDRAVSLMNQAKAMGYTVVDSGGELELMQKALANTAVAQRVPGSPGQSRLVVGEDVKSNLGPAEDRLPAKGKPLRVATVPAGFAGSAIEAAGAAGASAIIDPAVADIISMAHSEAVAADAPGSELVMRDYQRQAVGLHLATEVGYLQACSVGLGKTAITLRGMQGWAKKNSELES